MGKVCHAGTREGVSKTGGITGPGMMSFTGRNFSSLEGSSPRPKCRVPVIHPSIHSLVQTSTVQVCARQMQVPAYSLPSCQQRA